LFVWYKYRERLTNRGRAAMAETIPQSQVLAAKRWMADEAAWSEQVSVADAEALVAAVYALEEEEEDRVG
jgi:hypothetical protein